MKERLAVWWCKFIHEPDYLLSGANWYAYCDECGLRWLARKYRPA